MQSSKFVFDPVVVLLAALAAPALAQSVHDGHAGHASVPCDDGGLDRPGRERGLPLPQRIAYIGEGLDGRAAGTQCAEQCVVVCVAASSRGVRVRRLYAPGARQPAQHLSI